MRDFNDLFFFAAVVTHGGFSAAARALNVPKSRISRRIAVLETELNVRLLERSTRRFHVTDVGQDVYRHARAAMAEAEAVDEVAHRVHSQPQGLVRVSCPIGLHRSISLALPAFLEKHPLLRVQLIITNRRIDLIDEAIDVAIRVRERLDTDGDLQMKYIGKTRSYLAATTAFLDKYGRPQSPADLARLPTIAQNEHHGTMTWTLNHLDGRRETVEIEPRVSSEDYTFLIHAALNDIGVALIPDIESTRKASPGLERVLPEWAAGEGTLHLVFTSRRGLLPGVRAFIDFAADTMRDLIESPGL